MFNNFFVCKISSKNCIFNQFATERDVRSTKNICHWFWNVDIFFFGRNKLKLFTQLLNNDVMSKPTQIAVKTLNSLPWNYPSYKAYQGLPTPGNFWNYFQLDLQSIIHRGQDWKMSTNVHNHKHVKIFAKIFSSHDPFYKSYLQIIEFFRGYSWVCCG